MPAVAEAGERIDRIELIAPSFSQRAAKVTVEEIFLRDLDREKLVGLHHRFFVACLRNRIVGRLLSRLELRLSIEFWAAVLVILRLIALNRLGLILISQVGRLSGLELLFDRRFLTRFFLLILRRLFLSDRLGRDRLIRGSLFRRFRALPFFSGSFIGLLGLHSGGLSQAAPPTLAADLRCGFRNEEAVHYRILELVRIGDRIPLVEFYDLIELGPDAANESVGKIRLDQMPELSRSILVEKILFNRGRPHTASSV